jgi:hypothetical protein
MSLAELQRQFVDYIKSDGEGIVGAVSPSSLRGLPVYHHAYRASLIETLRDMFEQTHSWMGDDRFDEAALSHIASTPPNSWTLSDYGDDFDLTLSGLYPGHPEVAELAWMDWAMRRAFDGPDAGPLDMSLLGEVDWDDARLHLAPTLKMRTVGYLGRGSGGGTKRCLARRASDHHCLASGIDALLPEHIRRRTCRADDGKRRRGFWYHLRKIDDR